MSISSIYFLNGPSLGSSTAVFTDQALSILASDGFYSDGVISREQVGGVLLPQQTCPTCGVDCDGGERITTVPQRISFINSTLNSSVGVVAIIVDKSSYNNQSGIQVNYDGIIYNKIISPVYGVLQAPPNLPTYIGTIDSPCAGGLVAGSPYTLERFNWYNNAWVDLLSTEVVDVLFSQDKTTIQPPEVCVIIIPKPPTASNALTITVIDPCISSSVDIIATCPISLFPYNSNITPQNSIGYACLTDGNEDNYWFYSMSGTSGYLNIFDSVFSDQYGQTPLADGWYHGAAPLQTLIVFLVEDGVIVQIEECGAIDCIEYTASCELPTTEAVITYLDCSGESTEQTIIVTNTEPVTFCALFGSPSYTASNVTVSAGGPCAPTPNSAEICVGDGCPNACACGITNLVYYTGTLGAGTVLYSDAALTTLYTTPSGMDNISYGGICYTLSASTLVYSSNCSTPPIIYPFYISNQSEGSCISCPDAEVCGVLVYANSNVWSSITQFYSDISGTPYDGGNFWYYSFYADNGSSYQVNTMGSVINTGGC